MVIQETWHEKVTCNGTRKKRGTERVTCNGTHKKRRVGYNEQKIVSYNLKNFVQKIPVGVWYNFATEQISV